MTTLAFDVFYRDRGAERGLDKLGGKLDTTHGKFDKFKRMAAGFGLVAAAGILKFGVDSGKAFAESEAAQSQLAAAQARFPKILDVSTEAFNKQALAIQKKTKFDDESITVGQATLAQFSLTGKQIESLLPLVADYAQKTGKDMAGAAVDVGKAINSGQGKALKAVGIEFKGTGDKAKDFATIQDLLKAKVGGAAEAAGETAAGKYARLKNQFGEVQEMVGAKLVPALLALGGWLLTTVEFVQRNSGVIGPLVAILGGLVAIIWLANKAVKAYTVVQLLLNIALTANPIGIIIVAVAAFIAVIVLLWLKSSAFRSFFIGMWSAIWGFLKGIGAWFAGPFAGFFVGAYKSLQQKAIDFHLFITGKWNAIVAFVKGIPGKIASAASGMWDGFRNAFRSALNWIIGKWNALQFTIPGFSFLGISSPSFTIGVPDIPFLQRGGQVVKSGLAFLHPAEVISPAPRSAAVGASMAMAGGGHNTYHITVNVPLGANPREVGAQVVAVIQSYEQANGRKWRTP